MATAIERKQRRLQSAASERIHTLTGVQILATGSFAPETVVANEDLAALGYDDQWIIQRTGIRQRRRAHHDMATSDLAFEASRRCLERAGVKAQDVDLILVATVTPDSPMPATACQLQRRLGCSAPAMDLNAACSGFVFALATAAQYVHSGFARRVLVVGADLMSRVVNPLDKKTFPLFGDGAGAVLVGEGGPQQGLLAYSLGSDGRGAGLLVTPAGGTREPFSAESLSRQRHFIQMDGRAVFKWAVRTVADSIHAVLRAASLDPADVDLVALHQANMRIVDAVLQDVHMDRSKAFINLDRYGNTSAASIPLVLDEAFRAGRLGPDQCVLMSGFGAGLTWGTALFRW